MVASPSSEVGVTVMSLVPNGGAHLYAIVVGANAGSRPPAEVASALRLALESTWTATEYMETLRLFTDVAGTRNATSPPTPSSPVGLPRGKVFGSEHGPTSWAQNRDGPLSTGAPSTARAEPSVQVGVIVTLLAPKR